MIDVEWFVDYNFLFVANSIYNSYIAVLKSFRFKIMVYSFSLSVMSSAIMDFQTWSDL